MRPRSKKQTERLYQAGRGQGEFDSYQPWLRVRDVPSRGISSRVPGQKTGRLHHVLSRMERAVLMLSQWHDDVADIREQYPLWPLEETIQIADHCDFRHPKHPMSKEPVVMTTDFLLVRRNGSRETLAVKVSEELSSLDTCEKLLVENAYWQRRGVPWGLVTEEDIPWTSCRNIEWLFEAWQPPLSSDLLPVVEDALFRALFASPDTPLYAVCRSVDEDWDLERGKAVQVFRHALARKRWTVPLDKPVYDVFKPVKLRHLKARRHPTYAD